MSLFKRPAWAKSPSTIADDADEDLFRHSERSYRDIVAEQERNKKDRIEKKKAKEERRSSGKREIEEEGKVEGSPKRRRITPEDGEKLLGSIGMGRGGSDGEEDEFRPLIIENEEEGPVRRSPRTIRHVDVGSPQKPPRHAPTIDLLEDDDGGDENNEEVPAIIEAEPVEIAEDSDDEFAELARKARRERHQKEILDRKSHTPDLGAHAKSPLNGSLASHQTHQRSPPLDPVVQILIDSPIPDTNPLIVHRKLSQRLQEIRHVWCQKQGFSDAKTRDVFFIHRMRKVYDATTCRSLGLGVDVFGNIVMKGAEEREGADKVLLQAVTEKEFETMKAERELEAKRRRGEIPREYQEEQGGVEEEAPQEEVKIRLVLKAKGRKDFKIIVKPVSPPFLLEVHSYRSTKTYSPAHPILQNRRRLLQKPTHRHRPENLRRIRWRSIGAGRGSPEY